MPPWDSELPGWASTYLEQISEVPGVLVLRGGALVTGLEEGAGHWTETSRTGWCLRPLPPPLCFVFSCPYSVEGLFLCFLHLSLSLSLSLCTISAGVWTTPVFSKPFYCTVESPEDLVEMQLLIQEVWDGA